MERKAVSGITLILLLLATFGLALGIMPVLAEEWVPYVPEPWQWWPKEWSLLYKENEETSYIDAALVFPDSGFSVSDWGTVVIDGSAIWVDSQIWDWTGLALMVITTDSHTYDLGYLEAGEYTFTFKVWGYPVKSISFECGEARALSLAPDLCIEGVVLPYTMPQIYVGRPSWMNQYNISVTVANRGTADAGGFNVSFSAYLEGELILEYERRKTVEGLQQGSVEIWTFDFNPEYYGNYTLTITADCDNDIVELDEANNVESAWIIGTILCDNQGDVSGSLCDGDVDYYDFIHFAADYNHVFVGPPYPTTDVDWDGDVDYNDFLAFANLYGKHVPT